MTQTMIKKTITTGAVAFALAGGASLAQADSIFLNEFDNTAGVLGNQVRVDVSDLGNSWQFDFVNLSDQGSIENIYFETDARDSRILNRLGTVDLEGSGTDFAFSTHGEWGVDANPFGTVAGNPWEGTGFSFTSQNAGNGVNVGEILTLTLAKNGDVHPGLDELMALLGDPGYRIAVRLTGFGGGTASLISGTLDGGSPPVEGDNIQNDFQAIHAPTPAAFGAGLVLLAGAGLRRRRQA